MELIQPWQTTILKHNVSDEVDLEQLVTELITTSNLTETAHKARTTAERNPYATAVRDTVVTPKAQAYIEQVYGLVTEHKLYSTGSFGKLVTDGSGMDPHAHPTTFLSAVLYLDDSDATMAIMDPRRCQQRALPREIHAFDNDFYNILPRAGDLYLFPSYLLHLVRASKPGFRLSFVTDYRFESEY
jgi:hypothetical protein